MSLLLPPGVVPQGILPVALSKAPAVTPA